jgi:hypothetical protein
MKFLCVLGVLCGLCLSAFALDREAFSITKYDLRARIEPEQQRLAVRGKITLRNDSQAPQKHAILQVSSTLGWRSIRVAGNAVQFVTQTYTSDIDHTGALSEAIVTLPGEVPPQGTAELEIGYEGTVPLEAKRLTRIGVPEAEAKQTDWDQIGPTTVVRGAGYVAWYPIATEAANLSDDNSLFETLGRWNGRERGAEFRVTFQYEGDEQTLLCQHGSDGAEPENSGTSSHAVACAMTPLAGATPFFALGNYDANVQSAATVYFLPGNESPAERFASAAGQVRLFVSDWFGGRSGAIQIIELNAATAASFETGTTLFVPFHSADFKSMQIMAAHQLTHAFFPSPRLWVEEGLAHFVQALYRQQQDGKEAGLTFMAAHADALKAAEARSKDPAADSLVNTFREEFFRTKAMYVWWMLRDMVGEDALKKALNEYRPEQDKEASYMQRLIAKQSSKDLEWFFDDWVYRDRGLPDFRVVSVYPRKTLRGAYLVTVTVENLGQAGAEVPVTARSSAGETTERLLVRGKAQASIRLETPNLPEQIILNDGSIPESDMSNNTFTVQAAQPE